MQQIWTETRNKIKTSFQNFGPMLRIVIISIGILFVAILLLWFFDKILFLTISRGYIDNIAIIFNLNRNLAEAISLSVFVLLSYFSSKIMSFSRSKRRIGYSGSLALLVTNSLVLWQGTKAQFFNQSGSATKCYIMTREGVRFGERVGTDLVTGKVCRPVTPKILEQLQAYAKGKRPSRVVSENPKFFDSRTGEANLWYAKFENGRIQLFDLAGFSPETGQELLPVTPEIVQEWNQQAKADATKPPKRVNPDNYAFVDQVTGKPRVWYWRSPDGDWEFYDRPGFRSTGEALLLISPAVIETWKRETFERKQMAAKAAADQAQKAAAAKAAQTTKPPQRVDPNSYAFVDQVTGKPRVWYWRSPDGDWEFYDGPGFRSSGETLLLISPAVIETWKRETFERKQMAAKAAADQAQKDIAKQQSGDACDQAAANPYDTGRPSSIAGVEYLDLKRNARSAAKVCAVAVEQYPEQPRYKYDLARALEFLNPTQALRLYADLARQNYAFAFDGYGGLLWRVKKNLPMAIRQYVRGAQLGDPNAMVSLAFLIKRNLYPVADPIHARWALLAQAAKAGYKGAQEKLDKEQAANEAQVIEQQNQQQRQQQMMNVFQGVLSGIAGRVR